MKVERLNLPRPGQATDAQIEGHVFGSLEKGGQPWLAALILRKGRSRVTLGRDSLAGLLRFVAEHDPDMYSRAGVAGHRARVDRRTTE